MFTFLLLSWISIHTYTIRQNCVKIIIIIIITITTNTTTSRADFCIALDIFANGSIFAS